MGRSKHLQESYHIIEDSSTIAYEDYREQKKQSKSTASSDDSGATFQYLPQTDQPQYTCYPSGGAWAPQQYHQPAHQAAPFTAQFHPGMPYHQYQCYPHGAYGMQMPAQMTAAALPAYTGARQITAAAQNHGGGAQNYFIGRTRAQVEEDNIKIANQEGVWKYDPMKPTDANPTQLFWVVERDGRTTLRTFKAIEEELGPGKWDRDPRFGNAYFTREKK